MLEVNKVVARFRDGTMIKGTTRDFAANRPSFHIQPVEGGGSTVVPCQKLKAVFFVRDLAGDPSREDLRGFILGPSENAHGKKIAVKFRDGELLCGYTLSYTADRDGFFVMPSDTGQNNTRVYVVRTACEEVQVGPRADDLARRTLDSAA